MNEKIVKGLVLGYFVATSFASGYFVNKALEEKADELICEGDSVAKAVIIGVGHMAVSVAAGLFIGASLTNLMIQPNS